MEATPSVLEVYQRWQQLILDTHSLIGLARIRRVAHRHNVMDEALEETCVERLRILVDEGLPVTYVELSWLYPLELPIPTRLASSVHAIFTKSEEYRKLILGEGQP